MPSIRTACYRDSYDPDFWYLEVFDKSASKKNATIEIKKLTGASRIVAFGDNYNDLPMFEAADECYAVKTAPAEVIAAADVKPSTVGELVQCVYSSLAACYAKMIACLSQITGKEYTSVNIVGGGSKHGYLNALTAQATGLEVFAGPTEGTAIGNLVVQFIACGEFKDLAEARAAIARSFDVRKV